MATDTPPEVSTENDVHDVETQDEEVGESTSRGMPGTSRKSATKWILGMLVVVGVICAIAIPLALNGNDDDDKKEVTKNNVSANDSPGNSSSPSNSSSPTTSIMTYQSEVGPFNSSIELMSPNVLAGYTTDEDLMEAIKNAAVFSIGSYYNQTLNSFGDGAPDTGTTASDKMNQETNMVSDVAGGDSSKQTTTTSYGTNNQEQGIEEGDLIVSDGQYVYSGYGKYLVVWSSATGDIVKTIEMPPVNVTNQSPSSPIDSTVKLSSSVMAPYPYWQPEPYIQMLLLHEGRLLVIVGGYGQMHWKMSPMGEPENVISDLLSTHFRIYDTAAMLSSASTLPDAGLVGTKDENGLFNAIRSVNGNVHVVATSYLNTYPYLVRPLEVYNFATNITTKEYQQIVEEVAPDLGVNFTMQLMRDLKAGGATPRMTRINLWSETAAASGIEELSYPSGLMNSMVLVHSFNMASQTVGAALTMTSSGSFVPGWVQTYSSIDRIILAAGVYEYDDVTQVSKVSTALIAFGLEGASSVPQSIGTVPGSALSSYSLDVVGNFLRIATTVQNDTWIMIDSMMEVEVSDATDVNSTDVDNGNASTTDVYVDPVFTPPDTENYIIVMSLPGANGTEPGAMVEQGRVKIGKPKESITAMRFFDNIAYAVTFEKKDPLYVLDLSNPAAPTIVGELEISGYSGYLHPINADNTMILAIGEEADAEGNILGLQLSLFDMTVPSSPKNVSRFNIEFDANTSSYSEALWDPKAVRYADGLLFLPVNIANYYDASATTPFTGTMVFKVDSTTGITEVNQCRVANYVEEMDPYVTDMMSDTMSSDMMSPNTTLTNSTTPCNYTGGYLPTRSMVFNGNLMTTYYSEVIMTNLDTCQRLWNMTIGIPVPAGCPTYFM